MEEMWLAKDKNNDLYIFIDEVPPKKKREKCHGKTVLSFTSLFTYIEKAILGFEFYCVYCITYLESFLFI